MKPLALIPARGGSKGIPHKNLMNFCGLPLIAWSIKQAQEENLPVYVSTEDEDIRRCAIEFGAVVIERPAHLATDNSSTVDVLKHALDELNHRKLGFDTIVLLQPTSPLRTSVDIYNAIQCYNSGAKYLFSCYNTKHIEWPEDCAPFPATCTPRRQELAIRTIEHGMLYIYDECYQPLGMGELQPADVFRYRTPWWQSIELDEPDDIEICEFYMRRKILCSTAA